MICLPKHDFQSYFKSCLELFEKWSWLFECKNVDIMECGILDYPDASYLSLLSELSLKNFNLVPHGYVEDKWPVELKNFVTKCHNLKLNVPKFNPHLSKKDIDQSLFLSMKEKKKEEVTVMSSLVYQSCNKYNLKRVVDIGSGMGHIDRILHHTYGLKVLGIEMDEYRVKKAKKLDKCCDYLTAKLSDESLPLVAEYITTWLNGEDTCLIALHCCGDLSSHIGKLFKALPQAKCQIIIPCCYHRALSLPISETLKNSGIINSNLLRIACDTNANKWKLMTSEQHLAHGRSMLARALIQLFPEGGKDEIKKKFRRLFRSGSSSDWNRCLKTCLERTTGLNYDELSSGWASEEWRINQMEAFTCLQVCLQGVAEGLIIIDILSALCSEHDVTLLKVFDDVSSPRSIAIVVN